MGNKGKIEKKRCDERLKNDLPVLDNDHDFLEAFTNKETNNDHLKKNPSLSLKKNKTNKHGLAVIETFSQDLDTQEDSSDFSKLLEESFSGKTAAPGKKPSPLPLKKRLKRYPGVETQLDLHGYTAIGAQVKTRSFILSCKQQGFFTVRIVVGKGLHSDLGPVLPDVVEDVLKEMKKQNQVIFYEWDKKKKIKSGALIVYLKQFDQFD